VLYDQLTVVVGSIGVISLEVLASPQENRSYGGEEYQENHLV
jgi:hypothetical protein